MTNAAPKATYPFHPLRLRIKADRGFTTLPAVYNRGMLASARARLHYGWVIFVLSLGNLTVEGGTKNSESVYFHVLKDAFGRSATYTSAVFGTAGLVGALAAPLLGILLDRWGARVIFPMAGLVILFAWWVSSYATDLWQMFIFYGIFAGIGAHDHLVVLNDGDAGAVVSPDARTDAGAGRQRQPHRAGDFRAVSGLPQRRPGLAMGLSHLRVDIRRYDCAAQRPVPAPAPSIIGTTAIGTTAAAGPGTTGGRSYGCGFAGASSAAPEYAGPEQRGSRPRHVAAGADPHYRLGRSAAAAGPPGYFLRAGGVRHAVGGQHHRGRGAGQPLLPARWSALPPTVGDGNRCTPSG